MSCNKKVTIGDNNFTYCYDEVGNIVGVFDEDQINIINETIINNNGGDTYIINEDGDTLTNQEIVQVIKEYIVNGSNGTTDNGTPTYTTIINGQEVTVELDRFGSKYYNAANVIPIVKSSLVDDTDYIYPNTSVNNLPNKGWFTIPTTAATNNNGKNRTDYPIPLLVSTPQGDMLGYLLQRSGRYYCNINMEILLTGAIDALRGILFYNRPAGSKHYVSPILLDHKFGQADQHSLDTIGTDHPLDRGVYYPYSRGAPFFLERGGFVYAGGRVSPYVDSPNDDIDDFADHTHSASASEGSVTIQTSTDPDGEMTIPNTGQFRVRATGLITGVGDGGDNDGSQIPFPEAGTGFSLHWLSDLNGRGGYQSADMI